ncbi:hypothetical protein [Aeromonas hydrophila]|uniref:hypothetical protein n=1 Tax=Aeromonas hydrophila TaxID=644 RepID=UPI000332BB5F|nr:hypothetical protein [Aeromonas hydrophila]AGM43659.1 hypothetical protein AHML_09385 [Aeromonas hydrophila ML09-119]AHX32344.1 hypothetical protein V428_09645 [Aeromonas hydrophila subsp. hydrophila AL09-71]AHX69143.1 hypothetical protein V429_09650 [Aeromonas hydrophila pc104A]AJE36862.1 hypothetical protein V469_13845 [Aeromonas hydrophila J-1]AKJ35124.1 hypothetical protein U876_14250 [Aeromonas hydrophila NJ-35]
MNTLPSLQREFTENYEQLESLLSSKSYNEALISMDYRLSLIERFLHLIEDEPTLKQDAMLLSIILSRQEENMKNIASEHHQAIFKELSSIGLASKAKQIYIVNSKEF